MINTKDIDKCFGNLGSLGTVDITQITRVIKIAIQI
jgi:hypothetical protein